MTNKNFPNTNDCLGQGWSRRFPMLDVVGSFSLRQMIPWERSASVPTYKPAEEQLPNIKTTETVVTQALLSLIALLQPMDRNFATTTCFKSRPLWITVVLPLSLTAATFDEGGTTHLPQELAVGRALCDLRCSSNVKVQPYRPYRWSMKRFPPGIRNSFSIEWSQGFLASSCTVERRHFLFCGQVVGETQTNLLPERVRDRKKPMLFVFWKGLQHANGAAKCSWLVCAEPWKPGLVEAASKLSTEMTGQVSEFSVVSTFPSMCSSSSSSTLVFCSFAWWSFCVPSKETELVSRKKLSDSQQGLKVMKAWDA